MIKNIQIDDKNFQYNLWPVKEPVALVQIVHGMAEYMERYDDFAKFLNKKDVLVFGMDHRGHGKNSLGHLGHISDDHGKNYLISDFKFLQDQVKSEFPDIPLFVFGHSLGSFITRAFLSKYSFAVDGVILSGTGHGLSFSQKAFKILLSINSLIFGPDHISDFFNHLFNDDLNSKIKEAKTELDWLSYNEENIEKYMEDPLCGFNISNAFFKDIVELLELVSDDKNIKRIFSHLPILNLAGKEDPVGDFGAGVKNFQEVLEKYNSHSQMILYDHMRHEILNEDDKEKVYEDIWEFIEKVLESSE